MMYTYYQLYWFFLVYSFLGWCAGVAVNAVRKKKFVNTGFMSLPFCPSYGVAAVLCSIFLRELRNQIFFLFLGGALLFCFVTIVTGMILEHIFHRKWWDYSRNRFQFEGYISIWHWLAFGVCAVLILRVGNPLTAGVLAWIPRFAANIILMTVYALMGVDLAGSLIAVMQLKIRIHRIEQLSENMQKVTDEFGNALTGRIQKRMMRAYPNIEAARIKEAEKAVKKEQKVFAQGCGFYKLVWLFMTGAFLGDIAETVFCRVKMGIWMSRSSVVYGPFSIVWGLGCAMFSAFLYKYQDKSDRYIFTAGTVLGGAYEYICSVFTELVFGTVFWDYSAIPFNLGGRINLLYCFFWGIAAVIWLKIIYPVLSGMIEKIPMKPGKILTWLCVVFMVFNIGMSGLALYRYSERQKTEYMAETGGRNSLQVFMDEHFPDARMERIYPKAKIVE